MLRAYARYFDFLGRSDRTEFWWFCFSVALFTAGGILLDYAFIGTAINAVGEPTGIFTPLFILFSFVPSLSVTVRRLHDINRSGWWCLIGVIPILGFILMLIWTLSPGNQTANRFGPAPSWDEPNLRPALDAGFSAETSRTESPSALPTPHHDRFSQLERLAKLKDTNLLSEEEIKKLKADILRG